MRRPPGITSDMFTKGLAVSHSRDRACLTRRANAMQRRSLYRGSALLLDFKSLIHHATGLQSQAARHVFRSLFGLFLIAPRPP
jgi:hypothetical protein